MIVAYTVYTVRDCTGCVRYVGATSRTITERIANHRNAKTSFGQWIRNEMADGRAVTANAEEKFFVKNRKYGAISAYHDANEKEKAYIKGYKKLLGDKLFNVTKRNKLLNVCE